MAAPDLNVLPQILLSISLQGLIVGIFLLVAKFTIWQEIGLVAKIVILGFFYLIFLQIILPQIDPMTRHLLGLPPQEVVSNLRTTTVPLNTAPAHPSLN